MTSRTKPPDGFGDGILEAARVARIGIAITGRDGASVRYLWVNDVALEILGWPEGELLSRSPFDVIAPEELPRMREVLERRDRGGEITPYLETIVLRKDGSRVPVK